MIDCAEGRLGEERFKARVGDVLNRLTVSLVAPHTDRVLTELGVADGSKDPARPLVWHETVKHWLIGHDDVQAYLYDIPDIGKRAGTLQKAAQEARHQLPGVDLDGHGVNWDAVVRAVIR